MDAQQFLAEFGHIANAPGGVARLRELVLYLATSGKIVSQNIDEENAEKLLERIRHQATNTTSKKRGKSVNKAGKNQFATKTAIPTSWVMVGLGEIGDWGAGSTPSRSNSLYYGGSIPWFKSGELKSDYITEAEEHITELALKECSLRRNVIGDVLIAMYGANIGQCSIVGIESTTNQAVCACTPYEGINNRFLLLTLRAKSKYFMSLGAGGAQPNISKEKIVGTKIDLPPTEEQYRIVKKVDELMALCDKLEVQQQDRRNLQNSLRLSTLQAVANATSPHELQANWTRLADNFGKLFCAPEDVVELRGLILDMAMRGHLVHQDATEESAENLCELIESKKRELSQTKRLKLQKSLSKIGENEIPFDIPKGWVWTRLGQIAELINGDRGKNYPNKDEYVSDGIPWINTGHIEPNGTLTRHHMNFISREKFDSLNSGKIEPGDLVYCLRGATFGKTAFVTPYKEGAIASSLMIIRPIISSLNRFLYYYLISPLGKNQIFRFDNGTAQPNLSANSVGLFSYPLPPLKEQNRITAKIEQLMLICDALDLRLQQSIEVSSRLAAATISSLTGIAVEKKEEPMKAPQTELIAPLRLGTAPDIKAQAPLSTILARHNGEMSAKDLWQRFGGEIDAFYAQLKTEVAHGWIQEPQPAEMREKTSDTEAS